jgi:hypothetical protein
VRALLCQLGIEFDECRGRPGWERRESCWELVVATPLRALELYTLGDEPEPPRIAIVERESRTLMSMLRRSGVEYVVRRPVHPLALRLLLLHRLYRGPERRRRGRVSIGGRVRFRKGLRRRSAVMAELSTQGCRLLSTHAAPAGSNLLVSIPGDLCDGKTLQLRGRVVRTGPASGEESGTQAIAVAFEPMDRSQARRLQQTMARHGVGPAVLRGREERAADGIREPMGEEPLPESRSEDRRIEPRREYHSTVIALGEQAARVLLGRDLSMGGMRVDPHPALSLGDDLQIALHVGPGTEPLVVRARVERDDGEEGLVLQFRDLSAGAAEYLGKIVDFLPILKPGQEDPVSERDVPAEGGIIVSEILESPPD